jgi:hypothetical protein
MRVFNTEEARKWMVEHPMEVLLDETDIRRRWNPEIAHFEGSLPNRDDYFLTGCVTELTYTLPDPEPKEITTIEEALKCEKLVVSNRFNSDKTTYYCQTGFEWLNDEIRDIKQYCTDPDFTVVEGE